MDKYIELAKIINKCFSINGDKENNMPFSLRQIETARFLEIILEKETEYWDVLLEQFFNDIKR